MTGKADTGEAAEAKGTDAQEVAEKDDPNKAARPRRIVRSRSTAVAGEGDAPKAEGEAAAAPEGAAPAEGDAAKDSAPRPPRHDMRAPARPAGGPPRGPRPQGRGPRPPQAGAIEGMPQRPPRPGALPSRPRPEGMPQRPPRPGALPSEGGGGERRRFEGDRPRPPQGDRPGGFGGPRGDRSGPGGPRGDRPRFPRPEGAPGAEGQAPDAAAAKPAAPPKPAHKPAPPPAPPKVEAKVVHKAQAPAPLTSAPKGNKPAAVFVPLARAGQSAAAAKPVALTAKEALAAKTKAHSKAPAPAAAKAEGAALQAAHSFSTEALAASWGSAKAFLEEAGENAAALVDAWLAGLNTIALVATADADDVSSAARKAARRAVGVLKSRGVALPEKPKAAKGDDRGDTYEATMIPCDSFGTWSVAITSRDPGGRYRIAEVIAREPTGVIQAAGGWLSGSQLKEGRARAQSNVGMAPVVIPLAWARARVANALSLNAKSGQVVPLGYEACRELFEVSPDSGVSHPIADLEVKVTGEMLTERLVSSHSLHLEPEFAGWLPERRALDEMMSKVGERLGGAGTQDAEAVNNAIREETVSSTDRYFTPEVREQIASRMRDSAIAVRSRKGDDRALDVLAVARAVKEAGLITSPPREIPFLVAFFEKALGALARMGGGRLNIPVRGNAPQVEAAPAPEAAPAETST